MSGLRAFIETGVLSLVLCLGCSPSGVPGVPAPSATQLEQQSLGQPGQGQARPSSPAASAHVSSSEPPAATSPAAAGEVAHTAVSAPDASEGQAAVPRRAGPLQALEQMVTAQALLVSLLLAPVAKDGGELARVDATPEPSAPLR